MEDDSRVDLGELEEDSYVLSKPPSLRPLGTITCRRCGFPRLHWQEVRNEGWRLFDDKKVMHSCMSTFLPIEEEITNFLLNRLECRKMILRTEELANFYNLYPYGIESNAKIINAIKTCDGIVAER